MVIYGSHDLPFTIEEEDIFLSIVKDGDGYNYKRDCLGEHVEKVLLADNGKITVNPVEPLNRPKEITPYLMVDFERTIAVGPGIEKKVFTTFPVEIGVFISGNKDFEILDVMSLAKQKFTLYGDPRNGVICKYWKSDVYSSKPDINALHEGVLELTITNDTNHWVDVSKAVFDAFGMKVYYNQNMVSLRAKMDVKSGLTAETEILDSPIEPEMVKSLELFTPAKIPVIAVKFSMEAGL